MLFFQYVQTSHRMWYIPVNPLFQLHEYKSGESKAWSFIIALTQSWILVIHLTIHFLRRLFISAYTVCGIFNIFYFPTYLKPIWKKSLRKLGELSLILCFPTGSNKISKSNMFEDPLFQ